jgi:hypothetical protein
MSKEDKIGLAMLAIIPLVPGALVRTTFNDIFSPLSMTSILSSSTN